VLDVCDGRRATARGNTFVLKPSEGTPSASIRYAELFLEAGMPTGVFNVVQGDKVAVDALIERRACARSRSVAEWSPIWTWSRSSPPLLAPF
jgi:delta 1-pyrroline-5-carboxylate dehydrogenase